LSAAYQRFKKEGSTTTHSLNIVFGNPDSPGVRYCDNQSYDNDGYEVQDGKLSKRAETPMFTYYTTRSGSVLGFLHSNHSASNFTREVDDGELFGPDFETWMEEHEGIEMQFVTDTILGKVDMNS